MGEKWDSAPWSPSGLTVLVFPPRSCKRGAGMNGLPVAGKEQELVALRLGGQSVEQPSLGTNPWGDASPPRACSAP